MDPSYLVGNWRDLPTPALLVYPDRIRANVARALEIAGGPDRLRPHVKTHKCAQIVGLQMDAGITRFKCATLAEAEMLARAGVGDIVIAYPMVGANVGRLIRLARAYPDAVFRPLADHAATLDPLGEAARGAGITLEVLVDLDTGMHRTGVPAEGAAALYRRLTETPGLAPGGIHAYDGHIHDGDLRVRCAAAAESRNAALGLKQSLEREGLPVPRVVMGGTPSFPCHAASAEVELSPGTFVLHDAGYGEAFPDLPFEPAAVLLSRVVSRPGEDRFTLDLGHKAVAADPPGARGRIWSPEIAAEPAGQSEEHWVFAGPGAGTLEPGDPVYVLPTHICPTVALHERLYVVEGGRWTDTWLVTARHREVFC